MKTSARFIFMLLSITTLSSCTRKDVMEATGREKAQRALAPLKQQLLAALQEAMREGPEKAIQVCRLKAPEMTTALQTDRIAIGRTSHLLRNPANAPEPWLEPVLEAYLENPEDEDPRTIWIDKKTLGYAEPIYVKPLCLTCHGSTVDPGLQDQIRTLYPQDRAVGFAPNEFRGLFWVTLSPK